MQTIDETTLTKGQVRKLNALRKSVGPELGEDVFAKWLKQSESDRRLAAAVKVDAQIEALRKCLPTDPPLNLGLRGMTIKRGRSNSKTNVVYIIERITG